jgi:hypothetical protein
MPQKPWGRTAGTLSALFDTRLAPQNGHGKAALCRQTPCLPKQCDGVLPSLAKKLVHKNVKRLARVMKVVEGLAVTKV